jgi:hypothetical protein
MPQVDLAAAQHLLSPFSSTFFGVKFFMTKGSAAKPILILKNFTETRQKTESKYEE